MVAHEIVDLTCRPQGGAANTLSTCGAVVVPIFRDDAAREIWESDVWGALDDMPEFKTQGKKVQRVLGGFGALGNPSSFHHPTMQRLRHSVKKNISNPLFKAWSKDPAANLEMLFDRVCVRCRDFGSVSKESWHRDIYDGPKFNLRALPPGDEIFGGWLNLSDRDTHFVAILGSHKGLEAKEAQQREGGFAKVQASVSKALDAEALKQANKRWEMLTTNESGHIVVPPGHMLVFYQKMLHAVAGGMQPQDPQLRVFFGHRVTTDTIPLFPLDEVLANNSVPRIPSGQMPPMYSGNHYQFFSTNEKYRSWGSSTFKPQCLFKRETKNGVVYFTPGSKGDIDRDANLKRYMPSMTSMGFEPHVYIENHRATMTPEKLV